MLGEVDFVLISVRRVTMVLSSVSRNVTMALNFSAFLNKCILRNSLNAFMQTTCMMFLTFAMRI